MSDVETTERASYHKPSRAQRSAARANETATRFNSVLGVAGAVIVAIGVVLITRAAFNVSSPLMSVLLGFGSFVGVVAIVEFSSPERKPEKFVDLVCEEEIERGAGAVDQSFAELRAVWAPADAPDVPIRSRKFTKDDAGEIFIAVLASGAFAEVLRIVLHMRSTVGLAIWWYSAFLVVYFFLSRERHDAENALDRVVTAVVWSIGVAVVAVLAWMVVYVVFKGLQKLDLDFFTQDLSKTGPLSPGGGAKHAIIGTLEQVGIATIVVVPLGIMTAVYLHEINGRIAGPVRFITDAMSGLPSIVAGLLVFTIWSGSHGYSGAAGSAALIVLMLPTMTRASEEILRTVPDTLREGALALGSPHWRLVQRVVLPTALAGIVTASLLAIARAIGETAPMLLTAFGSDSTNTNPTKGPQSDLPLFVYKLIFLPNKTQQSRAWTGALILVALVLALFTIARLVARRGLKRLQGAR